MQLFLSTRWTLGVTFKSTLCCIDKTWTVLLVLAHTMSESTNTLQVSPQCIGRQNILPVELIQQASKQAMKASSNVQKLKLLQGKLWDKECKSQYHLYLQTHHSVHRESSCEKLKNSSVWETRSWVVPNSEMCDTDRNWFPGGKGEKNPSASGPSQHYYGLCLKWTTPHLSGEQDS